MSDRDATARSAAVALLSLRIAYGAALVAAPVEVAGNRWLGPGARAAAAKVPLRGLGAREVALHGLALVAVLRRAPARSLMGASIAGDLADIGAAALDRDGLPRGSAPATAAVAGGSALLTALVAALLDS